MLGLLLDQAGYTVDGVGNGKAALEYCRTKAPQAVLLDVMMPEMHGYEVCHRLKEDAATRGIKVYIVTAKNYAADRAEADRAGADGFFAKPLDGAALLRTLKEGVPPTNA